MHLHVLPDYGMQQTIKGLKVFLQMMEYMHKQQLHAYHTLCIASKDYYKVICNKPIAKVLVSILITKMVFIFKLDILQVH